MKVRLVNVEGDQRGVADRIPAASPWPCVIMLPKLMMAFSVWGYWLVVSCWDRLDSLIEFSSECFVFCFVF